MSLMTQNWLQCLHQKIKLIKKAYNKIVLTVLFVTDQH
jgi:hypothetical protein